MALVKFDRGLFRNGNKATGLNYGQIEPNQVWFDRAGMVEAQCRLNGNHFSDSQVDALTVSGLTAATPLTNKIVAEDGAFLQVDKADYSLSIPTQAGKDAGFPVGINYSTERIYDDTAKQRRKFFLTTRDWLPRIGYVEKGMRITTNTVMFDDTVYVATASQSASEVCWNTVKNGIANTPGTPIYAAVMDGSDGNLVINPSGLDVTDPTTYIVLAQVVAAYDNADRTCSFMFQILDGGTK